VTHAHDLLQRVWLLDVAGSTSSVQFSLVRVMTVM